MTLVRERFLVSSYGDNQDGVRAGLQKLFESLNDCAHAVIVVPTIGQVKGTMLATVLPEPLASQLIKHRKIVTTDGKTIELCGQATLKNYRKAEVYLDLWGSESSIYEIEALLTWRKAILVTWFPKDSERWTTEHQVETVFDDGKR